MKIKTIFFITLPFNIIGSFCLFNLLLPALSGLFTGKYVYFLGIDLMENKERTILIVALLLLSLIPNLIWAFKEE